VAGMPTTWVMEDQNNGGSRMEIQAVVQRVEAPRQLVLTVRTPGTFHGSSTYTLVDRVSGAVEVNVDNHYEFESDFARLMVPLIARLARKKMASDLDHLRSLVEGTPAALLMAAPVAAAAR